MVTGAGSGIGRASARRLAVLGAKVHAVDLRADAAASIAEEIAAAGGRAEHAALDVADAAAVEELAERVFATDAAVDVLHNNAGIGHAGKIDETELDDWRRVLGVNLLGTVHGVHAFVPRMLRQGRPAHVVNTASMLGLFASADLAPYTASKFGVVGLSLALNAELASRGVRVTALCPGVIATPIVGAAIMRGEYVGRAAAASDFYRRRGASPEAVAEAVVEVLGSRAPIRTVPRWQVAPLWLVNRLSPRAGQALARWLPELMR